MGVNKLVERFAALRIFQSSRPESAMNLLDNCETVKIDKYVISKLSIFVKLVVILSKLYGAKCNSA